MNCATLRHFVKFNIVGAMGVVVQLVALECFNRLLGLDTLMATGAAVETAVLHNFVWHERYTWADRSSRVAPRDSVLGRFLRFNLANGAVSLVGNLILMEFLMNQAQLPLLAANVVSIACCALLNFALSDRWVFRGGSTLSPGDKSGAPKSQSE